MSDEFDPSPRATKRRRTTRYSDRSNGIEDDHRQLSAIDGTGDSPQHDEQVMADADTIHVNTTSTPEQSVKKSIRRRAQNQTDHVDAHLSSDAEQDTLLMTGSKARQSSKKNTESAQKETVRSSGQDTHKDASAAATRTSGRQRRPPRRLVEAVVEPTPTKRTKEKPSLSLPEISVPRIVSPAPKGILTPSKKEKPKSQKSVAFNHVDKEIEEQFGFRDIDTPAPKKLPKKSTPYPNRSLNLGKVGGQETTVADHDKQIQSSNLEDETLFIEDAGYAIPVPDLSTPTTVPPKNSECDPVLLSLRRQVLSRLTSLALPKDVPAHLDGQYRQLHALLKSTIVSSESNSLLLLGPRGAGKTMLLDLALRNLEGSYSTEFHTVRLNGFLQTDDRLALREIWRQLGHSRDLADTETEDIGASYADTMASLLSLLSHPDEMATDETDANAEQRTSKSIVFILDEFDLFTTHPRQTLLYNLFDIAQSRKAPIVVIGCSSRMDVVECLEKRVKSRFSHRWLLVPGCNTLQEWESQVTEALTIHPTEVQLSILSHESLTCIEEWNQTIEEDFIKQQEIQLLIKRQFYRLKSLPELFILLHPEIAKVQLGRAGTTNKEAERQEKGATGPGLQSPSVLLSLMGLPVLHLSLLTSMCRLEAIHTLSTVNFNLVYTHYTELIDTSRLKQTAQGSVTHSGTLRKWNRELCREAWEQLGSEGLIVPVIGGRDEEGNSGGAEMEETRMWRSEVGLEDILWGVKEKFDVNSQGGGGVGEVLAKWCKEA